MHGSSWNEKSSITGEKTRQKRKMLLSCTNFPVLMVVKPEMYHFLQHKTGEVGNRGQLLVAALLKPAAAGPPKHVGYLISVQENCNLAVQILCQSSQIVVYVRKKKEMILLISPCLYQASRVLKDPSLDSPGNDTKERKGFSRFPLQFLRLEKRPSTSIRNAPLSSFFCQTLDT